MKTFGMDAAQMLKLSFWLHPLHDNKHVKACYISQILLHLHLILEMKTFGMDGAQMVKLSFWLHPLHNITKYI